MLIFVYLYIFIFGTLFGSFSSVIISRLKNGKGGILTGRSECPNCNHKLGAKDLVPIFSFLFSKGKCNYCKTKISFLYPILEIITGFLFLAVSYFLVDLNLVLLGDLNEIIKLLFFLIFSFLTVIYVFYDILYLEIPDSILFILISLTFLALNLDAFFGFNIFSLNLSLVSQLSLFENLSLLFSGIFIIGLFYIILLKGLKEIYDLLIIFVVILLFVFLKYYLNIDLENTILGNAILGMFLSFMFFFLQILISKGRWMGGGDLRIAILLGLLLGYREFFYGILIGYMTGAFIGIFVLIYKKTREHYLAQKDYLNKVRKVLGLRVKRLEVDTQIPFGPFLAIGIYIILFFGREIIDFFTTNYL